MVLFFFVCIVLMRMIFELTDLDAVNIRMNNSCLLGEKTIYVGAYPFVGIADSAVVLSETPEDYMW
jgi:hypothetical protein